MQWLLHLDLAEQEQNLLNYIRSQFARFCTLYIDVCSRKSFAHSMHCFLIDFSIISHLSHFVDTSCESSTAKLHRYWINEIAMWDERSEISVKHRWRCRMNHITSRQCTLDFIAMLRSRVLVLQMYLLLNSRYQLSFRCVISWRSIFRTSLSSDIRSIARSHVLQIDLTSYLKSIGLSNLHSFVSALYDLVLQNLRHRESLLESFRQYIAEKALKVTALKKSACDATTVIRIFQ